jgi:hypothetical protein
MLTPEQEAILKKTYYDPETGFLSAQKLYDKLKAKGSTISLSKLQDFVKRQSVSQITKPITKQKYYNTVYASRVLECVQMDLIVYDRFEYRGYKYILCIIDVYSRYCMACIPLKTREFGKIFYFIKKTFENTGKPANINCDNEFNTNEFNQYCADNKIITHFSQPDEIHKNAIVERFNGTIAQLINRWRIGTNQYDWPKELPTLVKNYNTTKHRTTGETPQDIWDSKKSNTQTITVIEHKFKVGDKVRKKNDRKTFQKGDAPRYSNKIHTIDRIHGNKIYLQGITRYYKPYELLSAEQSETQPEAVEANTQQIIHEKTQSKKKKQKALNKEELTDKYSDYFKPSQKKRTKATSDEKYQATIPKNLNVNVKEKKVLRKEGLLDSLSKNELPINQKRQRKPKNLD